MFTPPWSEEEEAADVQPFDLVFIVQGGVPDDDPADGDGVEPGHGGQGAGAADLDEIADFRWQLASQRAIHQVELLELVAELVDVVRERKARIVGGKSHFVPPRFHAKDLDRQSARKPVPVELELLEARELSKLGRQLACEGQSARVLVSADRSFRARIDGPHPREHCSRAPDI